MFYVSLWWCFTLRWSIAISLFSNHLWQFHHFFFLNRVAIGVPVCLGLRLGKYRHSETWSSAFVVWKGPFDIQDCNPMWASKPFSFFSPKPVNGVCDLQSLSGKAFCLQSGKSALTPPPPYLGCADHPLHCGFVAVAKWGNVARNSEVPGCDPGWSCSPITPPEGGRVGWKHWGRVGQQLFWRWLVFLWKILHHKWPKHSVIWETGFLGGCHLIPYSPCPYKACGSHCRDGGDGGRMGMSCCIDSQGQKDVAF